MAEFPSCVGKLSKCTYMASDCLQKMQIRPSWQILAWCLVLVQCLAQCLLSGVPCYPQTKVKSPYSGV